MPRRLVQDAGASREAVIRLRNGRRTWAGAVTSASAAALCALLAGCGTGISAISAHAPGAELPLSPVSATTAARDPSVGRSGSVAPVPARPARAPSRSDVVVSIPSIGVRALPVVSYVGQADDLRGTRIADRGLAASPRGPLGGVAPGDVGNVIITGHRTSAGGPFRRLPSLRVGAHILVSSGGRVFDYLVMETMVISFRSSASLALQSAAVPGHPGQRATRPMITLSTCATPEDHAHHDYWTDALGNPEHRIDKVGVLVAIRPE